MPERDRCPNCGSNEIQRGKLVGQLDLGGGVGFRARRRGILGWLRPDLRIPRQWELCSRCGMIWSFLDSPPASATNVENAHEAVEAEERKSPDELLRSLVWNVSCFVPRPVRRVRSMRRWLMRLTLFAVVAVPAIVLLSFTRFAFVRSPALWSCAVALIMLGLWSGVIWRSVQLRSRVRERSFQICPECEYDLRGEYSGQCPECGTRYLPGDLAIVWSRGLKMRSIKTVEERAA